jgi:hypothetical protein
MFHFCRVYAVVLIVLFALGIASASRASENGEGDSDNPLTPVEFNQEELVLMAVQGFIAPPGHWDPPYTIDPDGEIHVVPRTGSITYNFRIGDSAINIAGDHVEPAVTLYNLGQAGERSSRESRGLNTLACIGNRVRVLDGEAKGAEGWVVGKHGGAEHVMVDFADDGVFDRLAIGDKMRVYATGLGLKFENVDGVKAFSLSPHLVEALTKAGMGVTADGVLRVPVTHLIPAKILGSGLGASQVYRGDYDIQLFDKGSVEESNLSTLRFGDIVAIVNADHTFGRIYRSGAITIGVIAHSRSDIAGHGPGVTSILTSAEGRIEPVIDPDANLVELLNLR